MTCLPGHPQVVRSPARTSPTACQSIRTRSTRSGNSATTALRNSPANIFSSSAVMGLAHGNAAGSTAGSALAAISLVSKTARSCAIASVDSETIAATRSSLMVMCVTTPRRALSTALTRGSAGSSGAVFSPSPKRGLARGGRGGGVGGGRVGCSARGRGGGVGVGDDLAGIVALAQCASDEFVEVELLGPGDLDDPVHRRASGDVRQRAGHVLGGYGLDEHVCQAHHVAAGGLVGDAADELEE